jgi:BioD-like phosphotransacetylase family protein
VPGCTAAASAVSAQDAQVQAREAEASGAVCLVEVPAGDAKELAGALSARVVLVSAQADDLRLSDLASAAGALGDALLGIVVVRQKERALTKVRDALAERGLACLAVVPEDRLLAGPTIRELAETLRASRLFDEAPEDEAVEFVMLGPISSDPGQPYFLQHGHKAVVNRFDKMDLHLAALATEPDCLILTGGQQPSPYFFDRVGGSGLEITVLLAPEGTVRTVEQVDELYDRTRFSGQRKLERAIELFRQHTDLSLLS